MDIAVSNFCVPGTTPLEPLSGSERAIIFHQKKKNIKIFFYILTTEFAKTLKKRERERAKEREEHNNYKHSFCKNNYTTTLKNNPMVSV